MKLMSGVKIKAAPIRELRFQIYNLEFWWRRSCRDRKICALVLRDADAEGVAWCSIHLVLDPRVLFAPALLSDALSNAGRECVGVNGDFMFASMRVIALRS